MRVFTLGHSTRSFDEFRELLAEHGVRQVLDVRRFPVSRRFSHFSQPAFADALTGRGISYVHLPELGGRRRPRQSAEASYWRSPGLRGYAEYMRSEPFSQALARAIDLVQGEPSALLCAEAVPWRCHRQLIADALAAQGIEVQHILGRSQTSRHQLHPQARVLADGSLVYVA
jgi:uncharacterized protein (DUF488 family)